MHWIKYSKHNKPAQGLKIVCFNEGDFWVCRRLNYEGKDYWLEIPYGGNLGGVLTDEPKYWRSLELPDHYTGLIHIAVEGSEPMTLDEAQIMNPKAHEEFVKFVINEAKCKKVTRK